MRLEDEHDNVRAALAWCLGEGEHRIASPSAAPAERTAAGVRLAGALWWFWYLLLFVIIAGLFFIKSGNYHPFIPPAGSKAASGGEAVPSLLQDLGFSPGAFGVSGIRAGSTPARFASERKFSRMRGCPGIGIVAGPAKTSASRTARASCAWVYARSSRCR